MPACRHSIAHTQITPVCAPRMHVHDTVRGQAWFRALVQGWLTYRRHNLVVVVVDVVAAGGLTSQHTAAISGMR
jgi:hypothetical protein